ncbi:hypothetical protein QT06_C0001G0135 [archaeon GW2011_AR15]|nr:hypothetical protein QT06_C0001G0135 [archaeon GW2011_AR15]
MFERGNPYYYIDPTGQNPVAIAAGIYIGIMALSGGGQELAVQLIYSGRVYDWSRIGYATLEGTTIGAIAIATLFIPSIGPHIFSAITFGYEWEGYKELEESIGTAKENRLEDDESTLTSKVTIPNMQSQANNQHIVTPPSTQTAIENIIWFVSKTARRYLGGSTYTISGREYGLSVYQPARDAEGKTRWDRIIERNKERSQKNT